MLANECALYCRMSITSRDEEIRIVREPYVNPDRGSGPHIRNAKSARALRSERLLREPPSAGVRATSQNPEGSESVAE